MDNNKKSKPFIWIEVIFILLIALIAGAVFLFSSPNQINRSTNAVKTTLSPDEKMTQEVLYNPKPQPGAVFKPADKIIIKTVNFDTSGNITEVIMFTPAIMVDGIISIDGKQVEVKRSQEGNAFVLSFLVPEELRKKDVTFLVKKDGNQIATCSLVNGETLQVSGDCIF